REHAWLVSMNGPVVGARPLRLRAEWRPPECCLHWLWRHGASPAPHPNEVQKAHCPCPRGLARDCSTTAMNVSGSHIHLFPSQPVDRVVARVEASLGAEHLQRLQIPVRLGGTAIRKRFARNSQVARELRVAHVRPCGQLTVQTLSDLLKIRLGVRV